MDARTLLKTLALGEDSDLEFKSARGGVPGSLWETDSAMASTDGGVILLGRGGHGRAATYRLAGPLAASITRGTAKRDSGHSGANSGYKGPRSGYKGPRSGHPGDEAQDVDAETDPVLLALAEPARLSPTPGGSSHKGVLNLSPPQRPTLNHPTESDRMAGR